ncbi:hypothetical protein [Prosthecobacter fusiformis]|uniref:hypothetical protein n=1 Tax=Prosthecobacter fusiformis TaxID=48464 RepID=UPI001FB8C03F|nr:hypothetical protein [Prosthecobacter fusiformis]
MTLHSVEASQQLSEYVCAGYMPWVQRLPSDDSPIDEFHLVVGLEDTSLSHDMIFPSGDKPGGRLPGHGLRFRDHDLDLTSQNKQASTNKGRAFVGAGYEMRMRVSSLY